jgi:hypothetical protein
MGHMPPNRRLTRMLEALPGSGGGDRAAISCATGCPRCYHRRCWHGDAVRRNDLLAVVTGWRWRRWCAAGW